MKVYWQSFKKLIISSLLFNWISFFTFLILLGLLSFLLSYLNTIRRFDFTLVSWDTPTFCVKNIKASSTPTQFPIYVQSALDGNDFCQMFAKVPELAASFSDLRVEWSLPPEILERRIFEHHFDLLQVRPEDIKLNSKEYQRIAYFDSYKADLVAIDETPLLTANYLKGKTIGLIRNFASRSGYRVPVGAIREKIDIKEIKIKSYESHLNLRRALEQREVDMIGSYWSEADKTNHPSWHTLEIKKIPEGLNWFLSNSLFANKDLPCALLKNLLDTAQKIEDPYFAALHVDPVMKCGSSK